MRGFQLWVDDGNECSTFTPWRLSWQSPPAELGPRLPRSYAVVRLVDWRPLGLGWAWFLMSGISAGLGRKWPCSQGIACCYQPSPIRERAEVAVYDSLSSNPPTFDSLRDQVATEFVKTVPPHDGRRPPWAKGVGSSNLPTPTNGNRQTCLGGAGSTANSLAWPGQDPHPRLTYRRRPRAVISSSML